VLEPNQRLDLGGIRIVVVIVVVIVEMEMAIYVCARIMFKSSGQCKCE